MAAFRTSLLPSLLLVAALGPLAACTFRDDRVAHEEEMLSAAGFQVAPPPGQNQAEALAALPANQVMSRANGPEEMFFYADPKVCKCVYVGDATAYARYRETLVQQHLADQQGLARPPIYEGAKWDWGP